MVKKLRYYARFIVVCLLLKKNKQVKDLTKDFSRQIEEYVKVYDPEDSLEWQIVKNEIIDFLKSENIVNIDPSITSKAVLSNRLNATLFPIFETISINDNQPHQSETNSLRLQEILIIGNCENQVKLTILFYQYL
jgi:hypothetical protein